ncbi:ribonuclease H-like domain-containing protein [Tanacetum coccineum]
MILTGLTEQWQSVIVKFVSSYIVLSLVIARHWPVHQLDVKNAFLHSGLSETVYMHQPLGIRDFAHPDYVCLLQRPFYGLKQASRAWFQSFAAYITRGWFTHSRCDSSLFIYRQGMNTAYLLLYVDDLGCFFHRKYATEILKRARMGDVTLVGFPIDTAPNGEDDGLQLFSSSTTSLVAYSDADWVGVLLLADRLRVIVYFLATTYFFSLLTVNQRLVVLVLKPSIMVLLMFAVYMSYILVLHQRTKHIEIDIHFVRDLVAAGRVRVLHIPSRYQQGTDTTYLLLYVDDLILAASSEILLHVADHGLQLFSSSTTSLVAYSDADWVGVLLLADRLRVIVYFLATTYFLSLLTVNQRLVVLVLKPSIITVYMSSILVQHQRTKHIEIDIHFVRDLVAAGRVRVLHIPSRYQFADSFTKGLPSALFEEFRSSLSVRCHSAQTAEEF